MVREYAKLKQLFKSFKKEKMKDKKRFDLTTLEEYLIKKAGGVTAYKKIGGYRGLYQLLRAEEKSDRLKVIKNSSYNDRQPPLKTRWQLIKKVKDGWQESQVFSLSRKLDLNYFLKRPQLQTEELLKKLKTLAKFLQEKDKREWASREERSLELFADEKYLASSAGKKLLSRLNLSLADLKSERYSQMFVYWNKGNKEINKILILENHSAFISCKRAIESGKSIFTYNPDILIYGAGKHIIDSLKFLQELTDTDGIEVKYAGDIDPEGLAIYTNLKDKYPYLDLNLHLAYYKMMLVQEGNGYSIQSKQQKDEAVLKEISIEFQNRGETGLSDKIKELWYENLRIPQEVITYEVIKKFST